MIRPGTLSAALTCLMLAARCAAQPASLDDHAVAPAPSPLDNMLVVNEDNSHFFGSRSSDAMTMAGLHAFVDQYAGSAVTHLFLCPNAMRASIRSRTREAIWDPVDGEAPDHPWPQNAKRLADAGLDPYTVWIMRCREKKISPWLSLRMNDIHSVDEPGNFMHSSFWRDHPQFWRVPHGSASPWSNRALNYAHKEVREHQMAFVRELLERYDPDGLELDWMRFGFHLTPGQEREEGAILTEFMREARELTVAWSKRRGHPILLGVRVPSHPDAAAGLGMDAVRWAEERLVDLIVPCPFWSSSDFDIPVELWHERLGQVSQRVTIAPGIEHNSRPWPAGAAVANDLAALRGFAASAYDRGATSLYLFNWMDSQTRPVTKQEYQLLLREGLSGRTVRAKPRRHPVCYRDTVPQGFANDVQLPVEATAGCEFRIHIGPKPHSGKVWAVVGLAKRDGVSETRLRARLNGRELSAMQDVPTVEKCGGGTVRAVRFFCPLDSVESGYNVLHITQAENQPAQQVVWVEIRVDP